MRVGCMALFILCALACGDDDNGALSSGDFRNRDAATGCIPYYMATSTCDARDSGGDTAKAPTLTCEFEAGDVDTECADITLDFACGERITLVGCCTADSHCGVIDPTGVHGCIERKFFGEAESSCTQDYNMDAGSDDAGDDDASAPTT